MDAALNLNPDATPASPSADLIAWVEDAFASWKALRTEHSINGAGHLYLTVTQGLARALEAWGDRPLLLEDEDILDALTRLSTRQAMSKLDEPRQKIIVALTRNGRLWAEGEKVGPARQLMAKAIETGEMTMIQCLLNASDAPKDIWTAPMFKLTGDINTQWRDTLTASGNTPASNRLTVTLPALAIMVGQASSAIHVKDTVSTVLARLPMEANVATSAGHPLLAVMGADALETLGARELDLSQRAPNGDLALSVALAGHEERNSAAFIQALAQQEDSQLGAHAHTLVAVLLERVDHRKAGVSLDALFGAINALAKSGGKPLPEMVLPSGQSFLQALAQQLVTHPNSSNIVQIRADETLAALGESDRSITPYLKTSDTNDVPLACWFAAWAGLEKYDAIVNDIPGPERMALWLAAGGEPARVGMQVLLVHEESLPLGIALGVGAAMLKMDTVAPALLLAATALRDRAMDQIQTVRVGAAEGFALLAIQARLMQGLTPQTLTPREAAMELLITKAFGAKALPQQQLLVEKIIEDDVCRVETKQWLDSLTLANPELLDNNPSLRALHMGLAWDDAPAAGRAPRM